MVVRDDLIPVGKLSGTHGIKGHLKVYSYSGNIESLRGTPVVYLKGKDGPAREYGINDVSFRPGGFNVKLDGVDDIDRAKQLVGNELCLLRTQFPPSDVDEYYWSDLIGLSVVTDQGVELGSIVDIFETGSSDIYVVRGAHKEYLIPAIAKVVSEIDLQGHKVVITPLDGLLDL